MNGDRTRFYRDKINGKVFGVCAGIADYTGSMCCGFGWALSA